MKRRPQRHYTLDDYFFVEEMSETKHEFFDGEIFAIAGASLAHNRITVNLLLVIGGALREKGCNAFGSDLRVAAPSGLHTYPDVSVICGRVELDPGRPDTATNPVVLVEVLSDATRDYDRGDKFDLYRAIPTLREYLLVEQSRVLVEHHERQPDGSWRLRAHDSLDDVVRLESVAVDLPVREVYREVFAG